MNEPTLHRFGHEAMATRFEISLVHADGAEAARAAQAAFDDIDRLEQELSRHIPYSDFGRLNLSPAGRVVDLREAAMDVLSYGRDIWEETGGAFDMSIGPLYAVLRWPDGRPRRATPEELEDARARSGFQHLELDPGEFTAIPKVSGMIFDPGAIGKGYALDQAAMILREDYGIGHALLNAGNSTLLAIGSLPGQDGWPVRAGDPEPFPLRDEALSGTGFDVRGAHIIDPRSGRLVDIRRRIRWAIAPNATLADALSTAFMVMNRREIAAFLRRHEGIRALFTSD